MEYIYNMQKYEKLGNEKGGDNVMVQICVDRYIMYLYCYMNSGNYRFKKCMDTISSVLEIYINEIYSATLMD